MKGDGNLADLALGVASDEKDVITLPQNQTPRPKKGQWCDPELHAIGPPFFFPNAAPWLEPIAFGGRQRNLHRACGQVSYFSMIWGSTAAQTYQSHFWHVKEEYVWPAWVARYRRDMYLGLERGLFGGCPFGRFGTRKL